MNIDSLIDTLKEGNINYTSDLKTALGLSVEAESKVYSYDECVIRFNSLVALLKVENAIRITNTIYIDLNEDLSELDLIDHDQNGNECPAVGAQISISSSGSKTMMLNLFYYKISDQYEADRDDMTKPISICEGFALYDYLVKLNWHLPFYISPYDFSQNRLLFEDAVLVWHKDYLFARLNNMFYYMYAKVCVVCLGERGDGFLFLDCEDGFNMRMTEDIKYVGRYKFDEIYWRLIVCYQRNFKLCDDPRCECQQ